MLHLRSILNFIDGVAVNRAPYYRGRVFRYFATRFVACVFLYALIQTNAGQALAFVCQPATDALYRTSQSAPEGIPSNPGSGPTDWAGSSMWLFPSVGAEDLPFGGAGRHAGSTPAALLGDPTTTPQSGAITDPCNSLTNIEEWTDTNLVDSEPPLISGISPPAESVVTGPFTYRATIQDESPLCFVVLTDTWAGEAYYGQLAYDAQNQTFTLPFPRGRMLANGRRPVVLIAIDKAGNWSTAEVTYTVQTAEESALVGAIESVETWLLSQDTTESERALDLALMDFSKSLNRLGNETPTGLLFKVRTLINLLPLNDSLRTELGRLESSLAFTVEGAQIECCTEEIWPFVDLDGAATLALALSREVGHADTERIKQITQVQVKAQLTRYILGYLEAWALANSEVVTEHHTYRINLKRTIKSAVDFALDCLFAERAQDCDWYQMICSCSLGFASGFAGSSIWQAVKGAAKAGGKILRKALGVGLLVEGICLLFLVADVCWADDAPPTNYGAPRWPVDFCSNPNYPCVKYAVTVGPIWQEP